MPMDESSLISSSDRWGNRWERSSGWAVWIAGNSDPLWGNLHESDIGGEIRKRWLLAVLCRKDAAARGAAILPAG